MTGSTVMLKALYETVNGKEQRESTKRQGQGTPLDESAIPEAAGGMARQADYMAKGMGIRE